MNLNDLRQQISAYKGPNKASFVSVSKAIVASTGAPLPIYAQHLTPASNFEEFFENVYRDDSLRMEDVWAAVAKALHPDELLDCFTPVKQGTVDVRDGFVEFGSVRIPAPSAVASCCVLVFEDGTINESPLGVAGEYSGPCAILGYQIDGKFSVHHFANKLIVVPWKIGITGYRVSAKPKSIVC